MESPLTDELYLRFRDLLLTRAGLHYPERKRSDLLHGLSMALSVSDYQSLGELYSAAASDSRAWDLLLAHLTIGETYFFRNGPQFDAIRQHILPDILQRRAASRMLRVWSAGCATGEEPYSLAMTIGDLLSDGPPWAVSILATDINPQFLARAREGLYGEWSFRETPDELRRRFWVKEHSRWRLQPEIRRTVSFARLNLAEPSYPSIVNGTCAIDMLVCRNVTIYFDEQTTRQVVGRFFDALTPGGWLIVGHSEPQASTYYQFEVHNFPNTVIYRKPLSAPMFAFGTPLAAPPVMPALPALPARPPADLSPPRPLVEPLPKARLAPEPPRVPAEASAPKPPAPLASSVDELIGLSRQYADRGDWPAAVRHCEEALAIDTLRIEAHYLLAQIHEHQGAYDAALDAYRRTIYLDRGFVPGLIGMGNIWRQLGRPREARRSYQSALAQLAQLAATTPIPYTAGATAGDLQALVSRQIQALD